MKKNVLLIFLALLFVFADTAFFSKINLYGIRPYMVLSFALAATITFSVQSGMVIAAVCGLLTDLICNPYLGLTSAFGLLAVVLVYLFVRRSKPKKLVLYLALLAVLTALDMFLCLLSIIFGASVNMINALLLHALPCAAISAGLVILLSKLLKPLTKGQLEAA